jgi:penicillin-binding protein 2
MLSPGAHGDRQNLQVRLTGFRIAVVVVFAALAVAFWMLQILQYQTYRQRAENNHMRTIELRAPRGIVFDRHGEVLVQNRQAFRIALVREQTGGDLDGVLTRLAAVALVDEADVRAAVKRRMTEPVYRPLPVIENATEAQVAAVLARSLELPGVVVEQVPTRRYPDDRLAAHLFGYVGEVPASQVTPELPSGAIIGRDGVERIYNSLLMGENGNRFVVVNSRGREIEELQREDPVDGHRVQLTVDADLQRALEEAFHAAGLNGAGVFLDPRNGEVLAMTSLPAYDPNDFAGGIDAATWNALDRDPLRPLGNRSVQGRYAPGSTFKVIMAIAALEEKVVTPETEVFCGGSKTVYGRSWACSRPGGHGPQNLVQALQHSCNVYFYTLADMMPIDTIHKWAVRLGLVGRTGIDLPNENESVVPSEAWKRARFNDRWYPGETLSVAIGQGGNDATPIGLARMIATVANGGTLVTPHVMRAVDRGQGWEPIAQAPLITPPVALNPQMLAVVHEGLWQAVNSQTGTARSASLPGYDVVGKTGTAQVISLEGARAAAGRTDRDLRHHRWLVFFAPKENPEVAGVVFVEHGGSVGAASPLVRHVLDTYFAKKEGRPLPVLTPLVPPVAPSGGTGAGQR